MDINIVKRNDNIWNNIAGLVSNTSKARTNPISYNNLTNYITVDDLDNETKIVAPDEDFLLAHEYGHKINPTDRPIPWFYNPYIDPSKAPKVYTRLHSRKHADNVHDKAYAETYSDLIGTRYDLYKNGIYDSRSTIDFTEEDYDKYIEHLKKQGKHNRLVDQFDKEDFIEIINTIAQNNQNNRFSLEDINPYT